MERLRRLTPRLLERRVCRPLGRRLQRALRARKVEQVTAR